MPAVQGHLARLRAAERQARRRGPAGLCQGQRRQRQGTGRAVPHHGHADIPLLQGRDAGRRPRAEDGARREPAGSHRRGGEAGRAGAEAGRGGHGEMSLMCEGFGKEDGQLCRLFGAAPVALERRWNGLMFRVHVHGGTGSTASILGTSPRSSVDDEHNDTR